jgi:hypothetical protein
MMIVTCEHYKLAILRAYFYWQRRGVQGAEGARSAKPKAARAWSGDREEKRLQQA